MFSLYLKTAWRNIRKNRLFSFINVLGLSLGIGLCFIIMLYVQDELSYDRFNKNADNIVRVIFKAEVNGGKINESVSMPPVAQTMKNDNPEVVDATRIKDFGRSKIVYKDKVFKDDRFAFADANVFSIFTFPMLAGDAKTALQKANSVVMTESTARKYFGNDDPIGKIITVTAHENQPYTVTGVIKDIPVNAHFHFDMFGSMAGWAEAKSDSWMFGGYHTYLLLKPQTDIAKLQARFSAMVTKYMGPQIQQQMGLSLAQFQQKGNALGFALQPLKDIHLNSDTSTEFEPGGNKMYVYIFAGVALFMLIVACINFINLATAGATKRAKEVGVRKVAGSDRFQLIRQFLFESVVLTMFAMLLAFLLVKIALPEFNNLAGKQLRFDVVPVLAFIALGLLVGVLAGLYPAFYLSSFKPIAVLKGRLTSNNKSFGLRSGLVVFQFFISVGLIIGTIVVYQQMKYIRDKDLGFNKEQLISIPDSYVLGKNEQVFKQQLLQDPRVVNATTSWYKPVGPSAYNNAIAYPQGNDNLLISGVDFHVDEQYIPVMGMQLVSGRNFSKEFTTDSLGIILNETAVRNLGWTNTSALDKIVVRQNSDRGNNTPYHVIGVVKNFNFKSLHENISPLFMTLNPESGLIVKIKTADVKGLLATMKTKWDSYNTEQPFTYSFMDDLFTNAYATEQKTGFILNIFSLLTILVACLGLFGLVTYTAEQRTKEIGIRKVLGASVNQVTQMLSKEFLKLVLIASLIAFPVAWWAMNRWLQSFAYRIEISWWIFLVAGCAALLIALLTVCVKAIRAALANPVKSLRTE